MEEREQNMLNNNKKKQEKLWTFQSLFLYKEKGISNRESAFVVGGGVVVVWC